MRYVALTLTLLLCGCMARVMPYADDAGLAYTFRTCGHVTGNADLPVERCEPGYAGTDVRCTAEGDFTTTSTKTVGDGWTCAATWNNADHSGELCIQATCSPHLGPI